MESLHSSQMAVLSAPCQGNELHKQEAAHQREMALDMLSEIANVFDFPDLNRFLSVSWLVPFTTTSVGGCLYACGFLLSPCSFLMSATDLVIFL